MKVSWMFLAMLLAAGNAGAQMYKWIDKDGKVRYSDTPPPGAKTSQVRVPASGAVPADPAKDSKDAKGAKKGPLTPAEQEQDYRKRQAEASKAADKAGAEGREKSARDEGCERTRDNLRTLESGQRIARTNSSGERYFLDEAAVAQEIAKAQQTIREACK